MINAIKYQEALKVDPKKKPLINLTIPSPNPLAK